MDRGQRPGGAGRFKLSFRAIVCANFDNVFHVASIFLHITSIVT